MPKNINEILEKADGLRHNFYAAVKVAKMLDDFDCSINEISKTISSDQALTTTILKYCNSAQYGFVRKIATVKDAISVMGFKTLKSIVFTIVSKSSFSKKMEGYGLAEGELWRNSVSCAVYCRHLAEMVDYEDPDQAFTAGLLRDIGKLVLHDYVREDFEKIVKLTGEEEISFSEAEEKVLDYNHSQIGALMADKWSLPQILTDTIKHHHTPAAAEEEDCKDIDLIRIVHLCDYLTAILGYGIGEDGMMQNVDASSVEKLGFSLEPENMELLVSEMINLNSEIDSLASTF